MGEELAEKEDIGHCKLNVDGKVQALDEQTIFRGSKELDIHANYNWWQSGGANIRTPDGMICLLSCPHVSMRGLVHDSQCVVDFMAGRIAESCTGLGLILILLCHVKCMIRSHMIFIGWSVPWRPL